MATELGIPVGVSEKLGYYVYLYVDPRSNRPFYVGKGYGDRVLAHLGATGESRKAAIIAELNQAGLAPRLDILAHGLRDEETALRIEAAVIDLLGLDELANQVRGWRSVQLGRMTLPQLIGYYAATPVTVTEPALLIRINRLYRHGMSATELYEATRGIWKVGPRGRKEVLAFAVFEGVVREVYQINRWHPAGTTPYTTRDRSRLTDKDRWEFDGQIAEEATRGRYVGSSVTPYFPRGLRSSVVYVNM